MIMHIDGNSFYASCERIFRPDLAGKPIAVLSNNDGITIALNAECKSLGFKRGDVFFKTKHDYENKGVAVFSSNYALYADISTRLNVLYAQYAEEVEVYSIDESFLYLPDWKNAGYSDIARGIREKAMREVHVPVSVGIAPTKTLAKMCNRLAKKCGGVCDWGDVDHEETLKNFDVADIWGVGHAKAETLHGLGVYDAYALSCLPLATAKKYLSITGLRTVQELNGVQALGREERDEKKNITSSRSFAAAVTELDELDTALAEFTQIAVGRMRRQNSACRAVQVFLMTGRAYCEADKDKVYFNGAVAEFQQSTSYLPAILGAAKELLHGIYRRGYSYRKVMVNLLGLERDTDTQYELFDSGKILYRQRNNALMYVCDSINARYGHGCLHPGTRNSVRDTKDDGGMANWRMGRKHLSPEYTTSWDDVPVVTG